MVVSRHGRARKTQGAAGPDRRGAANTAAVAAAVQDGAGTGVAGQDRAGVRGGGDQSAGRRATGDLAADGGQVAWAVRGQAAGGPVGRRPSGPARTIADEQVEAVI